ncbi:MAG TPA: IS110 family transposase [Polyangia bacterium]|jgi:transposase
MEHIAIDLGGRESQVCVRSADGAVVEERRIATKSVPEFLAKRAPGRVIVETCTESFAVADAAKTAGHEVRVVPAMLVRSLGVGARRTKTDRRDAQALSQASCRIDLPSVHVPSHESRERKNICSMRDGLVRARTALINSARAWLRREARSVRASPETLPQRIRAAMSIPPEVDQVLVSIEQLTVQIRAADKHVAQLAKSDELCRRLMTVPGIGPITALRFKATLDEHDRFASAHAVQSYLGIVPGEHSSSERRQRLSITKAGPVALRWSLVQAAWSARRYAADDPMVRWCFEVEKRRGKRIAVVALARKLAGILFAIWRDGSVYDSTRGAAMS